MAVLKVIEIMASSPKSWEDAATTAVKTAGKTVKGIRSVYVQDMSALVKNNKSESLINLPLEDNWHVVYDELGLYTGQAYGTPCDIF